MFSISEDILTKNLTVYFGPAEVLSTDKNENAAILKIQKNGVDYNTIGKIAIPNCSEILNGDIVLAAGNDINNLFIIGLIDQSSLDKKLISNTGAYAALNKNDENIRVFSPKDELVFEYDPKSGNSKINIDSGNLEFTANRGSINFVSGQDINFASRQSIKMESQIGFQIAIKDLIGNFKSLFSLNQKKIKISSPEISLTAQRTGIQTEHMKYIGRNFSAVLKEGKMIIGKLETVATDIISKAKNLYNSIEELTQTRTGRMRTLIKSTLHIKSKNSYLNSEEDFKINAQKIHLG